MRNDSDAMDDLALALLYLTTFGPSAASTWKNLNPNVQQRLVEKRYLRKPKGKAPAAVLTARGWARAQAVCQTHLGFLKPGPSVSIRATDAATGRWYGINRSIAILKPKPPLLDWLQTLPDGNVPQTLDELQQDCTALLIPDFDSNAEGQAFIGALYEPLFEMVLNEWDRREALWPPHRTLALFREWFGVEIHSIVMDVLSQAIEKEDY